LVQFSSLFCSTQNLAEIIFTKEGRKEMVISLKNEMKKAIEKENYLDEEERVLINKFIEKIRNELKEPN